MKTALAALLWALVVTPVMGAECDQTVVRDRLTGFAPVGYGVGTGDRILQVWVNAQNTGYVTIIDGRGMCIVSPRIEDFHWTSPQQQGMPS